MTEPAVPQRVFEWLVRLHGLTAGSSSGPEAAERVSLIAPLLADRFPLDAFTRRSLERFWPSYAELVGALSPWWREHRPRPTALPPPEPAEPDAVGSQLTAEQRAQIADEFRSTWNALRADWVTNQPLVSAEDRRPLRDVSLRGEALRQARRAAGIDIPVPEDDPLGPLPPPLDEEEAA
jgi:hypothetical protein